MSNALLQAQIKNVLAREWGIAADAIPDDAALGTFDKWDSLGHIAIALALAHELGFELDADAVQALRSVPRIVEFVSNRTSRGEEAGHERCCT